MFLHSNRFRGGSNQPLISPLQDKLLSNQSAIVCPLTYTQLHTYIQLSIFCLHTLYIQETVNWSVDICCLAVEHTCKSCVSDCNKGNNAHRRYGCSLFLTLLCCWDFLMSGGLPLQMQHPGWGGGLKQSWLCAKPMEGVHVDWISNSVNL